MFLQNQFIVTGEVNMLGFFIGLFVGGIIGVAIMCIMAVAGDSDKHNH